MVNDRITVGEVARRCGVTADTIRYYEQRELIPEPPRTEAGYRNYPRDTVKRVMFIRHAQELGFNLEEISELLRLSTTTKASCAEVQDVARQKADELRVKIEAMQKMLDGLEALTEICPSGLPVSECPILDMLSQDLAE
ncbi:MAG: heavy metal-responsive transcriptional regulator [Bradymonadaceae bacterium]